MKEEIEQLLEGLEILLGFAKDGRVPSYSIIRMVDDNLVEFKIKSLFSDTSDQ
jgi:hypothetical protein